MIVSDSNNSDTKAVLRGIVPRLYQQTILNTTTLKNTLVVLPTGLGKTVIALLTLLNRLKNYPNSKILVLAPTRPLIDQHFKSFSEHLFIDADRFALLTGAVKAQKREQKFKDAQIIFSTPQGIENDLIMNRISLKDVSLVVFDEAHRATGNYAYSFIAEHYMNQASNPRILALTASPGSKTQAIREVCENLFIEDIEMRSDDDPDVKPYIQEVKVNYVYVDLPPGFKKVHSLLQASFKSKIAAIRDAGFIKSAQLLSRTDLLKIQAQLRAEMSSGVTSPELFKALSLTAEAMKVQHALELIETQGISAIYLYLESIYQQASSTSTKAVKNLACDVNIKSARILTQQLKDKGEEHPKLFEVTKHISHILQGDPCAKIILFNQFRDTASTLTNYLTSKGIKAELFVGQANKREKGLTQKEQRQMLQSFREGAFNVLVATSVAEEGLDIPRVDHVLFYEPIPSSIRTIQRRGRTGRNERGGVTVFVTKGTRDEIYRWSAHHKERRMYADLKEIKKEFVGKTRLQKTLTLPEEEINIFADHREKGSTVIKELIREGVSCKVEHLHVGDFVLSKRVCVEYKTVKDFVDSLIDGRIFSQLKAMKEHYERPILVVEGSQNIYAQRNIHPNAIRGLIATILVDFAIPLLQTKDHNETAAVLKQIAKREMDSGFKSQQVHTNKSKGSLKQAQEYIVSALPNVGPTLAPTLLKKFGSVKAVFNASEDELKNISRIGEKKAKEIQRLLSEKYE
ncbi:DEAD/DEAH box helicase [Candidatus Woesearchaeota archaeon]|nr:MAG: DEAD/DEAH box helicase [Candidatus Woesearchaeota archaeon]